MPAGTPPKSCARALLGCSMLESALSRLGCLAAMWRSEPSALNHHLRRLSRRRRFGEVSDLAAELKIVSRFEGLCDPGHSGISVHCVALCTANPSALEAHIMDELTPATTTFTIVINDDRESPVTWRSVSTDPDGVVVEDLTYTIAADVVPRFVGAFLPVALGVYQHGVEVDNTLNPELAAVEASFPTGEQIDAEDELRSRLTAEGITHGNF